MAKKRPLAPPASPTDEWGIYDPAKAGMQALYSRLGRPVLRASAASERRKRRAAQRPDRPADGVGLALLEARRRADLIAAPPVEAPAAPVIAEAEPLAKAAKSPRAKVAKASKRKAAVVVAAVAVEPPLEIEAPPPQAAEPTVPRRGRKPARTARPAAVPEAAAEAAPAAVSPAPPAVPLPSPRRPRGPVPLAAWAHAVSDTPGQEPKRVEAKGLWRGIFRIPSEVALVEYGRGCRIHRVVIETAADALVEAL